MEESKRLIFSEMKNCSLFFERSQENFQEFEYIQSEVKLEITPKLLNQIDSDSSESHRFSEDLD